MKNINLHNTECVNMNMLWEINCWITNAKVAAQPPNVTFKGLISSICGEPGTWCLERSAHSTSLKMMVKWKGFRMKGTSCGHKISSTKQVTKYAWPSNNREDDTSCTWLVLLQPCTNHSWSIARWLTRRWGLYDKHCPNLLGGDCTEPVSPMWLLVEAPSALGPELAYAYCA